MGQNNLKGASETVRCAKSLDIRITVDFLQMYATAKVILASDWSILLILSSYWSDQGGGGQTEEPGLQTKRSVPSKINMYSYNVNFL